MAGAGATRTGTSPHDNVRTELCTCALPGEERQGGHRPEIVEMHTSKTVDNGIRGRRGSHACIKLLFIA